MAESRKGSKQRKFGRKGRRPSHARYNNTERWIVNKARRIVKQLKKFPNYKPFNISDDVELKINKLMK